MSTDQPETYQDPRALICTEREADAQREICRRVITTYQIEDDPAVLTGADGADMTQAAVEWLEQFVEAVDPDTHPAYTGNPNPESVTVTLPRDVVECRTPDQWRAAVTGSTSWNSRLIRALADALDAASAPQEADQVGRVTQGGQGAERAADGRTARSLRSWTPKGLREHLCQQQTFSPDERTRWTIQILIDLLDVHRPIGNDGKHGERHTDTCGCEDR